jgi:hypothetical protein
MDTVEVHEFFVGMLNAVLVGSIFLFSTLPAI